MKNRIHVLLVISFCVFYCVEVTFSHAFTNTITNMITNNTKPAIEDKTKTCHITMELIDNNFPKMLPEKIRQLEITRKKN